MPTFLENLGALASQDLVLAYATIYVATVFLGNISTFVALWMAFQGHLGSWGVLAVIATIYAAEVSGDIMWYSLGRELRGTRFGEFLKNHMPYHGKVEDRIQKSGTRFVYLAKFVYPTATPVIFMIGWSRVEFRQFIRASFRSALLWVPFFFVVASLLISSFSLLGVKTMFRRFEWLFGIAIVLFLFLEYGLGKLARGFFGKNGSVGPPAGPDGTVGAGGGSTDPKAGV